MRHITDRVRACQAESRPGISVNTKKKEPVGAFKNGGTDERTRGQPHPVDVRDCPDKALSGAGQGPRQAELVGVDSGGKVAPYGIYDVAESNGWISLGIDQHTSEFAVDALCLCHGRVGRSRSPEATKLLITADCVGFNGVRVRL